MAPANTAIHSMRDLVGDDLRRFDVRPELSSGKTNGVESGGVSIVTALRVLDRGRGTGTTPTRFHLPTTSNGRSVAALVPSHDATGGRGPGTHERRIGRHHLGVG